MRQLYDLGYTYQEISDLMGRNSKGSIHVQCKDFPARRKVTISFGADLYEQIEKSADNLGMCRNRLMIRAMERFISEVSP